jgi:hypothetical protein
MLLAVDGREVPITPCSISKFLLLQDTQFRFVLVIRASVAIL